MYTLLLITVHNIFFLFIFCFVFVLFVSLKEVFFNMQSGAMQGNLSSILTLIDLFIFLSYFNKLIKSLIYIVFDGWNQQAVF